MIGKCSAKHKAPSPWIATYTCNQGTHLEHSLLGMSFKIALASLEHGCWTMIRVTCRRRIIRDLLCTKRAFSQSIQLPDHFFGQPKVSQGGHSNDDN